MNSELDPFEHEKHEGSEWFKNQCPYVQELVRASNRERFEPVHGWFGLSYCSYAVIPRSVAQSMPDKWQRKFVELMNEMNAALSEAKLPTIDGYKCLAVDERGKFTKDFYMRYARGRRNVFDAKSNEVWG